MTSNDLRGNGGAYPAGNSLRVDYASLLSKLIEVVEDDPARIRGVVYELARMKLRRAGLLSNPSISWEEDRRLRLALETAIERVETEALRRNRLRALQSRNHRVANSSRLQKRLQSEPRAQSQVQSQVEPKPQSSQSQPRPLSQARTPSPAARAPVPALLAPVRAIEPLVEILDHAPARISVFPPLRVTRTDEWGPPGRRIWPVATPLLRAAAVLILALVAAVIFTPALREPEPLMLSAPKADLPSELTASAPAADTPSPLAAGQKLAGSPPQSSTLPVPNVYGVYALSNGQLQPLETFRGEPPDPRVFMSAAISKPSSTVLPDGRVDFVVFRRDLANSAPDKIAVRVVAKIRRAITFNAAGKPGTAPVKDAWTIRNISYNFTVAPFGDNPEMILVRPEKPDFVLPAGRYALVLKGVVYDFTVAGPITDPAQCLERVAAVNGTFYSACKQP